MAQPIIIENPTKPKKIKAETKTETEIHLESKIKIDSTPRKEQVLNYLGMYAKTEFINIGEFLKALYGSDYEICKKALRELMKEHKVEIKADLHKLGSTWGERITKYGEEKDIVVEGNFINVPVFGRLTKEI